MCFQNRFVTDIAGFESLNFDQDLAKDGHIELNSDINTFFLYTLIVEILARLILAF